MIFAGLRLEAFGRLAGLANPLGDYGQGVRLLALTGARRSEVFGIDLAGNRPLVEDLDVAGRRARRIIASIPLNEQALDVRRGLCPGFRNRGIKTPDYFARRSRGRAQPPQDPAQTRHGLWRLPLAQLIFARLEINRDALARRECAIQAIESFRLRAGLPFKARGRSRSRAQPLST
jgi:hypothetical protein